MTEKHLVLQLHEKDIQKSRTLFQNIHHEFLDGNTSFMIFMIRIYKLSDVISSNLIGSLSLANRHR